MLLQCAHAKRENGGAPIPLMVNWLQRVGTTEIKLEPRSAHMSRQTILNFAARKIMTPDGRATSVLELTELQATFGRHYKYDGTNISSRIRRRYFQSICPLHINHDHQG